MFLVSITKKHKVFLGLWMPRVPNPCVFTVKQWFSPKSLLVFFLGTFLGWPAQASLAARQLRQVQGSWGESGAAQDSSGQSKAAQESPGQLKTAISRRLGPTFISWRILGMATSTFKEIWMDSHSVYIIHLYLIYRHVCTLVCRWTAGGSPFYFPIRLG